MKELIRDIIIVILVAVCIVTLVKPIIVKKTSMEPTLYANDYLIVSKQAYTIFGEPKRGDIVVFPHNTDGLKELFIKRVIGLPGDKITISDGFVEINGKVLEEPYTKDGTTPGSFKNYVVPDGRVFVMGEEAQIPERVKLLTPFRVTKEMLDATENKDVIFLHCLPSFHDFETKMAKTQKEEGYDIREVTDEVFRSRHSKVFDEAENRLHTIKAVIVATIA